MVIEKLEVIAFKVVIKIAHIYRNGWMKTYKGEKAIRELLKDIYLHSETINSSFFSSVTMPPTQSNDV